MKPAFVLVVALIAGSAREASAQRYQVIDLGVLPGDSWSQATAINDEGQVVCNSFLYSFGGSHAFLWENGRVTPLLVPGGEWTNATAINERGHVVGIVNEGMAAVWAKGRLVQLGTLADGPGFSEANAINDQNQIAGWASGSDCCRHPFSFFDSNENHLADPGEMRALPNLGGYWQGIVGRALGINSSGNIVGYAHAETIPRPVLWKGNLLIDLHTVPYARGEAHDINSQGRVVGWAEPYSSAFAWSDLDLDDVSDPGEMIFLDEDPLRPTVAYFPHLPYLISSN